MKLKMFIIIRKQLKVFNAIIIRRIIDMMHNFFRFKIPLKVFFHYDSMFENISLRITKRMIGTMKINISHTMSNFFFPFVMLRTFFNSFCDCFWRLFFAFMSKTHSFFHFFRIMFIFHRRWFSKMSFAKSFFMFFRKLLSFLKTMRRNMSFLKSHSYLHIKSPRSACLEITVKLSTHTKRLVLAIKNLLPLSNISILQNQFLVKGKKV